MDKTFKDEEFQSLLKRKQRLERITILMPFTGIIALFVFLYLFQKEYLFISLLFLILVLLLVISQYLLEKKLALRIQVLYLKLTKYFQENIVPNLLKRDNPSIHFDFSQAIEIEELEKIDVFNQFKYYRSRFHYELLFLDKIMTFDEVIFDGLVSYNTKGTKEFDESLDRHLNYHIYQTQINYDFETEALFIFNDFEELPIESIFTFSKVDLNYRSLQLPDEMNVMMFLKDPKKRSSFMKESIIRLFREAKLMNQSLIIYVNGNQLTIIFEEFENLINTPHSKRFTMGKLLHAYKEEQSLVRQILYTFNHF